MKKATKKVVQGQLFAVILKDEKSKNRPKVIGKALEHPVREKVIFFNGKQPYLHEVVVVTSYEDKGKFLVANNWRPRNQGEFFKITRRDAVRIVNGWGQKNWVDAGFDLWENYSVHNNPARASQLRALGYEATPGKERGTYHFKNVVMFYFFLDEENYLAGSGKGKLIISPDQMDPKVVKAQQEEERVMARKLVEDSYTKGNEYGIKRKRAAR